MTSRDLLIVVYVTLTLLISLTSLSSADLRIRVRSEEARDLEVKKLKLDLNKGHNGEFDGDDDPEGVHNDLERDLLKVDVADPLERDVYHENVLGNSSTDTVIIDFQLVFAI